MAQLKIDDRTFEISLAIFDKDGTLIDYELMWNAMAEAATESLLTAMGKLSSGAPPPRESLLLAMGLDPATGRSDPDGPLAVGPNNRIYTAVHDVLVAHGMSDASAQKLVATDFIPTFTAHPPSHRVKMVGDIGELFARLKACDVTIIVATADYRETTVQTMQELGVAGFVDDYVCADDRQHPVKHNPDALLHQGRRFGVSPANIMMVGDTVGDLRMAREARIGLGLGVLSGAGNANALSPWADVLVNSIDDITVEG